MALVVVYQEVVLLITEKESKVLLGKTIALGGVVTGLVGFGTITSGFSVLVQEIINKKNRGRIIYFIVYLF
jgi:hypothetical protein